MKKYFVQTQFPDGEVFGSMHTAGQIIELFGFRDCTDCEYIVYDIAICGLLHDLCKICYYVPVKKSRKTGRNLPNGKPEWEDYMGYDIEDKLPYGHGEKSAYVASGFMRLTREEAVAIRFHMGAWQEGEARDAGNAFEMYPLALLTSCADMMATSIDEKEK